MGVAWELGRANCLLATKTGQGRRSANEAESWRWKGVCSNPTNEQKQRSKAGYWGTIAKSEGTRDGQLAVLADHSTDGQQLIKKKKKH
jgi:hypothetical protein